MNVCFFFGMGLYALYEIVIYKTATEYGVIVICIMAMFLGSSIYFTM